MRKISELPEQTTIADNDWVLSAENTSADTLKRISIATVKGEMGISETQKSLLKLILKRGF